MYEAHIRRYGVTLASPSRPFAWQRFTDPQKYYDLLRDVGFKDIQGRTEQLGYHLHNAEEGWDIVWNSDLRGPVSQLSPERLGQFKTEHLAQVAALSTDQGIWLEVPAIYAVGRNSPTN